MIAVEQIKTDETGRRHKWRDPVTVNRNETPSACEQSERTCSLCGLVKITVHPPDGFCWREWRKPGRQQVQFEHTPPCREEVTS